MSDGLAISISGDAERPAIVLVLPTRSKGAHNFVEGRLRREWRTPIFPLYDILVNRPFAVCLCLSSLRSPPVQSQLYAFLFCAVLGNQTNRIAPVASMTLRRR